MNSYAFDNSGLVVKVGSIFTALLVPERTSSSKDCLKTGVHSIKTNNKNQ